MNTIDLHKKSIMELRRELAEKRDEARELRFKLAQGEAKNVCALRKVKKNIAQILTVLNSSKKRQT